MEFDFVIYFFYIFVFLCACVLLFERDLCFCFFLQSFLCEKSNNLTGSFNSDIFKLPKLEALALSDNKLEGTVPKEAFYNIRYFDIGNNLFSGTLELNTSRNASQVILDVSTNQFNGTLPDFTKFPYLSRYLQTLFFFCFFIIFHFFCSFYYVFVLYLC